MYKAGCLFFLLHALTNASHFTLLSCCQGKEMVKRERTQLPRLAFHDCDRSQKRETKVVIIDTFFAFLSELSALFFWTLSEPLKSTTFHRGMWVSYIRTSHLSTPLGWIKDGYVCTACVYMPPSFFLNPFSLLFNTALRDATRGKDGKEIFFTADQFCEDITLQEEIERAAQAWHPFWTKAGKARSIFFCLLQIIAGDLGTKEQGQRSAHSLIHGTHRYLHTHTHTHRCAHLLCVCAIWFPTTWFSK